MPLPYKAGLKHFSRSLRSNMTDCEHLLWSKIRRKQMLGVQFYRQRPVGPYILDFYANYPKLAIELDGGQHYEPDHMKRDRLRDDFLRSLGIQPLRFSNLDMLQNCDGVLEVILGMISKLQCSHTD